MSWQTAKTFAQRDWETALILAAARREQMNIREASKVNLTENLFVSDVQKTVSSRRAIKTCRYLNSLKPE